MKSPSERLLVLLSILQSGQAWSGADLAARLGASPRTLRRDVDRLRELGYPVHSTPGRGGSYRLTAGQAMPPLILTDDEAVATVVGLRYAALARVAGTTGAAEAALHKLLHVLPHRLRHRMDALSASTEAASRTAGAVDLAVLQQLASASYARQDVRFTYADRQGRASRRRVEPYRQLFLESRWYLLGWDLDRRDWRTFRVDRIGALAVPGTTFRPRELPPEGPLNHVRREHGAPVDPHHGVVRFAAPLAVVSERLRAHAGSLEAVDDASCRYVVAGDSWPWLAQALAAVGVPYVVEGPPELREATRELAARIARAAVSAV